MGQSPAMSATTPSAAAPSNVLKLALFDIRVRFALRLIVFPAILLSYAWLFSVDWRIAAALLVINAMGGVRV